MMTIDKNSVKNDCKNKDKNKQKSKVKNAARKIGICPKTFRLINIQCIPPKKNPNPKKILDRYLDGERC